MCHGFEEPFLKFISVMETTLVLFCSGGAEDGTQSLTHAGHHVLSPWAALALFRGEVQTQPLGEERTWVGPSGTPVPLSQEALMGRRAEC